MGFFDRITGKKETELSKVGASIERLMQEENQRAQKARAQIEKEREMLDTIGQFLTQKQQRWDDYIQLTRKELEAAQHLEVLLKALDHAKTSLYALSASMTSLKEASSAQQAQAQLMGKSAVRAINQQIADTSGIAKQIVQHIQNAYDDIMHIVEEAKLSEKDLALVKDASDFIRVAADKLTRLVAEEQKTAKELKYEESAVESQRNILQTRLQEIQKLADEIGQIGK